MTTPPSRLRTLAPFDAAAVVAAYRSALQVIEAVEPTVAGAIRAELTDQRESLKLIASENYASPAVLLTMGNWLSDKYAEGTIGHRFYAGCQNIDIVEQAAADHAKALFGAPHAYVQPHSGIDANLVAFWAILAQRVESPVLAAKDAQARQRPHRRRLGGAAPRPRQPARARHEPGRRRPPDARLPAEHQRQDVRAVLLRHRPADRAARLRRRARQGARVPAADPHRRLLRLSAPGQLRHDARDRRRGRRRADGRHGALRRAGRRQGADRRLRPGAARARRHDAPRTSRCAARAAAWCCASRSSPTPSTAAARWCSAARSATSWRPRRSRSPRPAARSSAATRSAVADNAVALAEGLARRGARLVTGGTDNHLVLLDVSGVRAHRPAGGVRAARLGHRHQPQRRPARPERRLVHLRRAGRHAGAHLARVRRRRLRPRRRADGRRADRRRRRPRRRGRGVQGEVRDRRRRGRPRSATPPPNC